MKISEFARRLEGISLRHNISSSEVYDLVEFQDFKRMHRGMEQSLDLSCRVVERYLQGYFSDRK